MSGIDRGALFSTAGVLQTESQRSVQQINDAATWETPQSGM